MKRGSLLLIIFAICSLTTNTSCGYASKDSRTSQILAQGSIIREGELLAEAERFEEALLKFQEALDPKYIKKESDRSGPHYYRALTYRAMGAYVLALKESNISIAYAGHPQPSEAHREIAVLAQYESTGDAKLVSDYIQEYISTRKWPLYQDTIAQSTLIRLYDAIGEYDKGIEFVDKIVEHAFTTEEAKGVKMPSSIDEATAWIEYRQPNGLRDPNWRAYKWLRDFMRIKEGFQLDKQQGTKGRATRAILKSDYLPW